MTPSMTQAGRQLAVDQVDPASRSDLHAGHPDPADGPEVLLVGLPVNAVAGTAAVALPLADPFLLGQEVDGVVDLLVWLFGGDGDGPHHAVRCLALVARCGSATIVELEFHEGS
jgi:hypothetical protein